MQQKRIAWKKVSFCICRSPSLPANRVTNSTSSVSDGPFSGAQNTGAVITDTQREWERNEKGLRDTKQAVNAHCDCLFTCSHRSSLLLFCIVLPQIRRFANVLAFCLYIHHFSILSHPLPAVSPSIPSLFLPLSVCVSLSAQTDRQIGSCFRVFVCSRCICWLNLTALLVELAVEQTSQNWRGNMSVFMRMPRLKVWLCNTDKKKPFIEIFIDNDN